MAEASLLLGERDAEATMLDLENPAIFVSGVSSPRFEIETTNMAPPKQTRRRSSKTSKKAEMSSLEDKLEEKMRLSIETRFHSFEEKILGLLTNKTQPSCTVTCNTSGGCNSPETSRTVSVPNDCTTGASSRANIIPLENSLNDEFLGLSRVQNKEDDILSLQPGQREKRCLDLESESEHSHHSQSECSVFLDKTDSRFSKYKSGEVSENTQNVLSDIFGEDARTGKSSDSSGIMLDKSQSDTLSQSWRTEQPDKLTAYKENYKSNFPLQEKTEEFLKIPSLDDIVETFLIKRFSTKACFKRARSLYTQHLKEIEKLAYQGQVAAKVGITVNLYMQQALRVLLEELKTDKPNIDLATQTVRDIFAMSTKTLDQLGRTGAFGHIIRRKATVVDMGLENVKDLYKQADLLPLSSEGVLGTAFETKLKNRQEKNKEMKHLLPELESRKNQSLKRKSSSGNQYGDKQRRYNDYSRNFNSRSYSNDYRSPLSQLYGNNNYRNNYSYRNSTQQKKSGVSSFRNKSKK